ncbi:MAG: protoheme IX farnesyltransferase [Candidatus Cloacimonetes bacterium]|nr:protoheme IX farnesyltransferase [Candidatus Cloacimonadota bacterium]
MQPQAGILLELIKIRVTAAVALTAAFGFLLAEPQLSMAVPGVFLGLWLQAAGSASLNHWQERHTDALMERTRSRPLPTGRIRSTTVLAIGLNLLVLGSLLLFLGWGAPPALAGLASFVCYNLLYTPLKTRSHLAVLPGSLSGAIPPFVGWLAAGGRLDDPLIWFVAAFLFIWQFPHFWILLLLIGEEYHRAGLRTLASHLGQLQLRRLSRNWVFLLVLAGLSFMAPRFGLGPWLRGLLAIGSLGLLLTGALIMGKEQPRNRVRRLFLWVNAYTLLVLLCLTLAGFVSRDEPIGAARPDDIRTDLREVSPDPAAGNPGSKGTHGTHVTHHTLLA